MLMEFALRLLTHHPLTSSSNRVNDPVLPYRLSSDYPRINSEGFRAPEQDTLLDVATVGDSFTLWNRSDGENLASYLSEINWKTNI